jgi:CDP-diacylglycerol---glycerol-3-phosphate 3-phosphatidyltransferase
MASSRDHGRIRSAVSNESIFRMSQSADEAQTVSASNVDSSRAASSGPEPIDRRSLNLPNLITLSRLGLSVVLFWLIQVKGYWITSAIVFAVAAATDAIDGYIARKYGLVTTLGRILDPFVDKIIVCGSFVFLLEQHETSGVNAWMVIAVIGREMFITGLRSFLEQNGRDFSAVWLGKIKMALQCLAVTMSLLSLSPHFSDSSPFILARDLTLWSAVGITIYSGISYAWRGFLMLRQPDAAA